MKISLFAIKLDRPLQEGEVDQLMYMLPAERRERLMRLSRPELRDEPLCAYAALQIGLQHLYGWDQIPPMQYNSYGKPYFAEYPEVHFNISHTRGAVLVGIHDQPLGVDIERIRPVSERTMERTAGVTTEKEFFESWVRRESRVKCSGSGLAAMREQVSPALRGERFCFIETFPGYAACVCTHSSDELGKVARFRLD